jgi:hypothetical protein
MKPFVTLVLALSTGLVGGFIGARIAVVTERTATEQVVRARKFELVDGTGRPLSYWGIDQDNYAVLAFGWYAPGIAPGSADAPRSFSGGLANPRNQSLVLGVAGSIPFTSLRAPDGDIHLHMGLNPWGKPIVSMADETGRRLFLGVLQSDTPGMDDKDWALSFQPDMSAIGMRRRGKDGKTYEGFVFLNGGRVVPSDGRQK